MTAEIDWLGMAKLCMDMHEAWPEMQRLAGIERGLDGYGPGGGGVRGSGVSNPTATTTLARAGGKDPDSGDTDPTTGQVVKTPTPDTWSVSPDFVGTTVAKLLEQSEAMAVAARRTAVLKRLIQHRGDARYGRQSSLQGDCLACDKPVTGVGEDRIKSGYCPTCHRAWLRFRWEQMSAGKTPDHEVFRKRRRAKAKADAKNAEMQKRAS